MKVIYPQTPTLTYTNVAADSNTEWSDVTTYGLDDVVKVTTSAPHLTYKSLRDNNTNRIPADSLEPVQETATSTTSLTIGDGPQTLTIETGKSFSEGMEVKIAKTTTPLSINMSGEVTSYDSGTGALVVEVSSTKGTGTHAVWTITSEDEIGFWEETGATNQYKMLDQYVNSQTVNTTSIVVKLTTVRADYLALFGLAGNTVSLELWNSGETVKLWDTTIDLAYGSSLAVQISDWYEYFFGEYDFKEDINQEFGAIIYEGVLKITITATTGEDAKCGMVVLGRALEVGHTQFGASAGITDFSYRDTDDQGRTIVTPGYWAKMNSLTLYLDNAIVDSVYKKLVSLRGVPTAWIGSNTAMAQYEAFTIYGIFKDFSVNVQGPNNSYCDLTIEGLI